jgi:sugar phosphate isomerase/epimerase
MLYDGSPNSLDRLRQLPKVALEVLLPSSVLLTLSVPEIADPLLDEGAEVVAVKLVDGPEKSGVEGIERAVIVADELGAELVVVPVEASSAAETLSSLDEAFNLIVAYSKRVALEPTREALPKAVEFMRGFLGGVFKLSISPSYGSTTEEVLALSLTHFGQLAAVKLAGFTREGKVTRVSGARGLNAFAVIKELVERGYDSYFVLDYEAKGLVLPPEAVRSDCDLLAQYIRSLLEKV